MGELLGRSRGSFGVYIRFFVDPAKPHRADFSPWLWDHADWLFFESLGDKRVILSHLESLGGSEV